MKVQLIGFSTFYRLCIVLKLLKSYSNQYYVGNIVHQVGMREKVAPCDFDVSNFDV